MVLSGLPVIGFLIIPMLFDEAYLLFSVVSKAVLGLIFFLLF